MKELEYAGSYEPCGILKALKIVPEDPTEECAICPFYNNCPEDVFNGATKIVIKILSDYLENPSSYIKKHGKQRRK